MAALQQDDSQALALQFEDLRAQLQAQADTRARQAEDQAEIRARQAEAQLQAQLQAQATGFQAELQTQLQSQATGLQAQIDDLDAKLKEHNILIQRLANLPPWRRFCVFLTIVGCVVSAMANGLSYVSQLRYQEKRMSIATTCTGAVSAVATVLLSNDLLGPLCSAVANSLAKLWKGLELRCRCRALLNRLAKSRTHPYV